MTKYRLNSAEKVQVTLYNVPKTRVLNTGKKVVTYSNYLKLVPGKVYVTDDEAMLDYFRTYKRKVRFTAYLEKLLQEQSVPYEIEYCKSCGGKVRKISYRVVEVLDE